MEQREVGATPNVETIFRNFTTGKPPWPERSETRIDGRIMKKIFWIRLLALTLLPVVSGLVPVSAAAAPLMPIQLTQAEQIADIEELSDAVGNLTSKIKQCAASGLAPMGQCHCRYPGKLAATKSALNRLLHKYPDWQNRAVLWWDTATTEASNLHLGGLGHRISQPCSNTELSRISVGR